jgi:HD-GYP domain-containing protein (c-di-GMP phosphodiesterase class II)
MSQRFVFRRDEFRERVSKGNVETRLLAHADGVEVVRQYLPQDATFYLDSSQEWPGFEFLYLLEGKLHYLGSTPPTPIEPGDYISRYQVPKRSWFEVKEDAVVLYISSQPSFHLMREDIEEFLQLACRLEADEYLDGHCERLEKMAKRVGYRLGLTGEQIYNLSYAAFFHDLGKARIPKELLQKPGKLTEEEWEVMKKHTLWGREMLEEKEFLKEAARIVEQTHERVDGQGYPKGLKGDEISLEAKIIAVVDAYDAMTTDRPYRKALPTEEAIRELRKHTGSQFDERVVRAFIKVIEEQDRPAHRKRSPGRLQKAGT